MYISKITRNCFLGRAGNISCRFVRSIFVGFRSNFCQMGRARQLQNSSTSQKENWEQSEGSHLEMILKSDSVDSAGSACVQLCFDSVRLPFVPASVRFTFGSASEYSSKYIRCISLLLSCKEIQKDTLILFLRIPFAFGWFFFDSARLRFGSERHTGESVKQHRPAVWSEVSALSRNTQSIALHSLQTNIQRVYLCICFAKTKRTYISVCASNRGTNSISLYLL